MIEKNSTQIYSTDFTCNGVMKYNHQVYYIQSGLFSHNFGDTHPESGSFWSGQSIENFVWQIFFHPMKFDFSKWNIFLLEFEWLVGTYDSHRHYSWYWGMMAL